MPSVTFNAWAFSGTVIPTVVFKKCDVIKFCFSLLTIKCNRNRLNYWCLHGWNNLLGGPYMPRLTLPHATLCALVPCHLQRQQCTNMSLRGKCNQSFKYIYVKKKIYIISYVDIFIYLWPKVITCENVHFTLYYSHLFRFQHTWYNSQLEAKIG